MTDIAMPLAQPSPIAPGALRRLTGFDLVVIAATIIASFAFAFFGAAVAGGIYGIVLAVTQGKVDQAAVAANKDLLQTVIFVGAVYATAVLPLGVWGLAQLRGFGRSALGLRRARWWWYAIGLAVLAVLFGYDFLITHFLDPDHAIAGKLREQLLVRPDSLAWIIALWVVVAPATAVAEELLYRGMLYRWFRERLPVWLAILVSSVIFGLLHGSLISPGGWMGAGMAFGLTMFGVIAAFLFEASGSLWPSILVHFVNNSLFVIGAYNPSGG
ncbi:MAG: lysostaphin resistance A-like protein [Hypericibacter sp.]